MAEIDLGALKHNVALLAARVAPARLMAVVKADAYGHGAMACARSLEPEVWGFAVSLVEEGVELRRGGIEKPIVVLGGVYGRAHPDVIAYRLTPVVWQPDDLVRFARAADELAAGRVGVHLKVDTGMARLGVRPEGLPALCEAVDRTPGLSVTGLATHLAEADGPDESATRGQLAAFGRALQIIRSHYPDDPLLLHVANTAGGLRFAGARFDLVRPGLALFGGVPSGHIDGDGLEPVLRWRTRIVALRDIAPGDRVSYGGLFQAARQTRIATIPVGYADGYTRRLTGQAQVLVAGRRCPVAGAITMDMAMVDVTEVPAELGDEVVLIGPQRGATGSDRIRVEELAAWSGTVAYEIYCGISKRVPRVYLDHDRS